ncbi:MAG: hypothetical protein EOO45_21040, partial [Flavobacterium sp.]
MNNDFSSAQRQSLIGVVVMFADTLQKVLRAAWPFLIVWIFKIDSANAPYFWLGAAVIIILAAVAAYLQYRNFTFHIDESNEEFVIHTGVFNKSRIAIPLNKIQQVNINQSLVQKLVGVHALEVDTAGSSKKEVSIRAINHELALALKERLLDTDKQIELSSDGLSDEPAGSRSKTDLPFIQISLLSLIKTGITSNYVRSFALLLAFVITAFQYIEDFLHAAKIENDPLDEYLNTDVLVRFMVSIIVAIIVLTLIINLVRTIIRFYNFRITKQQNSLLLSYGLLNTKNTIIRPDKVQIVRVGRNYFQKKMNILDLKIKQASTSQVDGDTLKNNAIEIPGCNESEKEMLLKFLLEKVPERGVALRPNIRKIIMETVMFVVIPVGVYSALAYNFPELIEYAFVIPFYLLFAGLLIFMGFRNARLFVNDEFIIKQSGAWDVDRDFIAPHK